MPTPDSLERDFTLLTAAARYDALRARDALAATAADLLDEPADSPVVALSGMPLDMPLDRSEALEMLALGEVLARKAGYGRQLAVRSARAAGASWSQIGEALGTSKQAAWEAHNRWIDEQADAHRRSGYEGMDEQDVADARSLAGRPETDAG
jgi:hypothetical protein